MKNNEYHTQKKQKQKTEKGKKIGKQISRIIRERLHTSTKVEVCEYHELCNGRLRGNDLELNIFVNRWLQQI